MVHPGDHVRHRVLLLREQRGHQVVLVVARRRHHHVRPADVCLVQDPRLAGVTQDQGHARRVGSWARVQDLRVLLDDRHVVPALLEVGRQMSSDVARAGDDDLHSATGSRSVSKSSVASLWTMKCTVSPSWNVESSAGMNPLPPRSTPIDLDLPLDLDAGDLLAHQVVGELDLEVQQRAARQGVTHGLLAVEQEVLDLFRRPPHAGDGGDVQPLVDLGPAWVVDPGDHLGDVEVLPGHPSGHDVRVVAVGHGDERVRLLDARVLQDVPVEPDADDGPGVEPRGQAVERLPALVDDGHRVSGLGQLDGQLGADPAASHDHEVHGATG